MTRQEMERKYPFINSKPFSEYDPYEFADHIKSIINHTKRISYDRKQKLKARAAKNKPAPRIVSFRILPTGKGSITIRRKDKTYLLRSELDAIFAEHPAHKSLVMTTLEKRKLIIKPDPKEPEC